MRLKIRCDGECEKFCKIFWEVNKASVLFFISIRMGGHLSSTSYFHHWPKDINILRLLCTTLHVLVVVGGDELARKSGRKAAMEREAYAVLASRSPFLKSSTRHSYKPRMQGYHRKITCQATNSKAGQARKFFFFSSCRLA